MSNRNWLDGVIDVDTASLTKLAFTKIAAVDPIAFILCATIKLRTTLCSVTRCTMCAEYAIDVVIGLNTTKEIPPW